LKRIYLPLRKSNLKEIRAGQVFYLNGVIYTARDQAHKKAVELLKKNKILPWPLKNQIIYYCGPTLSPPGFVIGSCGPTTSQRMDGFTEPLFKKGLSGMIGKGGRSLQVRALIKRYRGVYFLAPSGCGALLSEKVLSKKLAAFPELGPEAVYRLEVKDFPVITGIDSRGNDILDILKG
jgi:fumarate hydratase subunit beta